MRKFLAFIVALFIALPALAQSKVVPTNIQLFGPAQTTNETVTDTAGAPKWIGSVLSGSTHFFPFSKGVAPVASARLLVLWAPRNVANYVRLVSADSGPTNIVELARLQSNGNMGPSAQAIDVTQVMNNLITAGVDKQVGFQIGGDGINAWTLYEVQLEINYRID